MVDIITLNLIGSYKFDFYFEAHFLPQNFFNQSKLSPMQDALNEVLQHIRGKEYIEENYEPHPKETSHTK